MEFRSWPAGSLSPGTDPAALRVITTAVLVGLVASGVALASGLGLLTGGAGAQRPLAGQALANGPAQAAGLKLLREAAQACRSLPYQGVEVAGWGPGSQTGGDTSVVQVWHQPGGQALTQAPGAQVLTQAPVASPGGRGQHHQPVSPLGSNGPNLDEAGVLGMSTRLVSLLAANYVVTVAGRGQVAGRPARIVTVRRPGGGVAAWFWLDSATSLPLRKEMFDARARPVSSAPGSALTKSFGTVVVAPVWATNTLVAAKQLADWHGAVLAQDTLASNVSVQRSAWSQHRNTQSTPRAPASSRSDSLAPRDSSSQLPCSNSRTRRVFDRHP